MVLAFAGHRPEKLPWAEESEAGCQALKQMLRRTVETLAQQGYDTFLCGMARGCDFYFAEAVLAQGLRLEAYLPCPSQPNGWKEADRRRYDRLLLDCAAVYMVEPHYTPGCMLRRNQVMVDHCDTLLTVYDGTGGGTGAAIAYAKSKGKQILGLWL